METVKLLLMAYLKYTGGRVYENSSVSSEVTKNGRHDQKKSVSPHGTAVFLKHFFATLSSVYPVTRRIKCCLQYCSVKHGKVHFFYITCDTG